MIKKIITGSIFCFACTEAALPPLYESINEYKGLLEDPGLSIRLDSADSIKVIERRNDRFFIKTSTGKHLEALIVFEPQEMPGPARFHFNFMPTKQLSH